MSMKMKKLLLIHTNYQQTGGEDVAVLNELELWKERFTLDKLIFSNEIKRPILQTFSLILNKNFLSKKILEDRLKNFNPDYCIVHNTWFEGSLVIFDVLKKNNIKSFIKLHNYRHQCNSSFLIFRHIKTGDFCRACGIRKKRFQIFNKCSESSYIRSIFMIRYSKKYLKILKKSYFQILVLGNFQKKKLIELGVDEERVHIFQNYLSEEKAEKLNFNEPFLLFGGRITHEKGVRELIKTFLDCKLENINLKIIGEGPLLEELKQVYNLPNIDFVGKVSNQKLLSYIESSVAVVTSTKTFEGQPTILCEASMLGKVSIFPETGSILEFFPSKYSYSFTQYDYVDLKNKIIDLVNNESIEVQGRANKDYILEYLSKESLINKFNKILEV